MTTVVKKHGSILAAFFLSLSGLGQSAPGNSSATLTPVTVGFFVMDRKDQPVPDVKESDLTILDNKQPVRSIVSLKKDSELPLRLGLLIDSSNSERASSLYQPAVKAASELLNQILSGPDDKVVVVKVSNEPEATALMSSDELLKYKVDLTAGGGTAFYDGVVKANEQMIQEDTPQLNRRVLVLLSDGDDDASRANRDEALASAFKGGVVIFAVSTDDDSASVRYSHSEKGNSTLKKLAEKTGGEAFLHLGKKDIEKVFSNIREQIQNMYSVTFDPPEPEKKGFHSIELKVSRGDKARVRASQGYYLR